MLSVSRNYNTSTYRELPAYLTKLFYRDIYGKRKIFYFTIFSKLYCVRNKYKDLIIVAKNITDKLFDKNYECLVDKLLKIEYIRNEKRWKKYDRYPFLHYHKGSEEIIPISQNEIRIRGYYPLWGIQKIDKKEVE